MAHRWLLLVVLGVTCRGGRGELVRQVLGKNLVTAATLGSTGPSRSILHCCSLCVGKCQGVVYSHPDCWLLGSPTACELFDGECSECSYKVVQRTLTRRPQDCCALLAGGATGDSVYSIHPPTASTAFPAYCDLSGGGWTVIQRRVDDSVDFYRGWADYVTGFGDLRGNLWAGLEKIHALSEPSVELIVTMHTFDGESAVARYSYFSVGDAASGYVLSVSGYSGTAGDSMTYHHGQRFSTFDHDQDGSTYAHCATTYHGAWWYNVCHDTNPNGLYLHGQNIFWGQGVVWRTFRNYDYSLKTIEFKVRRVFV